jgi:protein O-GlcNAc transferase
MKNTNKNSLSSQTLQAALSYYQSGQLLIAEELCRKVLLEDPKNTGSLHILGAIATQSGRYETAVELLSEAIRIKKNDPVLFYDLGLALQNSGKLDEAVIEYKRALARKPDMAAAHINIGNILKAQGSLDEAEMRYKRAIVIDPKLALAHYNLGSLLHMQKKPDAARVEYEQAIDLNANFAEARINLGALFKDQGKLDEAVAQYKQAITINPRLFEAYSNLGVALNAQKKTEEAIEQFERAVALAPDNAGILAQFVHRLQHVCAWDKAAVPEKRLLEMVREGREGIPPFFILNTPSTPADQLICARNFGRKFAAPPESMFRHAPRKARDRIRIGYLSADLHHHAIAFLTAELFERHDRTRFDVTAYSYGPDDGSDMRQRLIRAFERFVDIRNMPHAAVAQKINNDGIDILIDLTGCTEESRIYIPAYRPAPIQVNYLGYPGTMGIDFIDYIIADPFILPMDQQLFYSEKIVQLPDCYQPNDTRRRAAETVPSRKAYGLPEQGFVFCCFNQSYKIRPAVFDIWMRLLQATEGSVLWLLEYNAQVKDNLRKEAFQRGIDPARLVFAPIMGVPEHLARHRLADLFLDTLPVNAHTTTSDALWAGLPVLTCVGSTFAGRVAGSLLKAANLPELITYSLEEYEALALQLAQNPGRLSAIRQKLEQTRLRVPLFDIEKFTRNIEKSYQTMWDIYQAGDSPKAFTVSGLK